MERNKKTVVFVIIGFVLFFIFTITLTFVNKRSSPSSNTTTENEGPGTVVIEDTDSLRDILLQEQYSAVIDELISYIQVEIDIKIEHAFIEGTPVINSDGIIVFGVKTEAPERQFKVVLDRISDPTKIIFSVEGTNYQKELPVYSTR